MKTHYDAFLAILSDGELLSLSSAKFASPLGITVLGTKVHNDLAIFVRIYNLEISNIKEVRQNIQSVVGSHKRVLVGLTLVAGNVLKSLQLAKWLKKIGCDIVVGGPEVTSLTAAHLSSVPIIDGVIVGFGEHIIVDIIKDGLKKKNYTTAKYFDFKSSVNYSLIYDLEKHGGVSMLWGGDCHLRDKRCYFCSRQKRGFGWRDPRRGWQDMQYPYQNGIKKIYNTADTVAVNLLQLENLAKAKPNDLKEMQMKCFINATQVTDKTAALFNQLNAWATIGIESCSRVNIVGKGKTTTADNYRALEVLAKHDVPMILTFVMGLPDETEESLQNDAKEILQIVQKYQKLIYQITISPLLIAIGSRAFDNCYKLLDENLPTKDFWEFYNPLLMTERYFKNYCSVELNEVYRIIVSLKNQIRDMAPEIIFDSKGLDPERWSRV